MLVSLFKYTNMDIKRYFPKITELNIKIPTLEYDIELHRTLENTIFRSLSLLISERII